MNVKNIMKNDPGIPAHFEDIPLLYTWVESPNRCNPPKALQVIAGIYLSTSTSDSNIMSLKHDFLGTGGSLFSVYEGYDLRGNKHYYLYEELKKWVKYDGFPHHPNIVPTIFSDEAKKRLQDRLGRVDRNFGVSQ